MLVNRRAARGASDLGAPLERLAAGGLEVVCEETGCPEEIPERIRHQEGFDLILLGGGDGTVNRAAGALLDVGLPVGLIPLGTANDLARSLQIPQDPHAAAAVVVAGRTERVDLGRVNEAFFFNVASIGLGPRVTRRLDGSRKRRLGILAYLVSFFEAWRASRPFRVNLEGDGVKRSFDSIQLAVGNGRHYGGGWTVAEDAWPGDGELKLFSIDPQGLAGLVGLALALRTGSFQDRERMRFLRGKRWTVRTDRELDVDTDGELTTRTPAAFGLLAGALEFVVPADYGRGEDAVQG